MKLSLLETIEESLKQYEEVINTAVKTNDKETEFIYTGKIQGYIFALYDMKIISQDKFAYYVDKYYSL